MTQQLRISVGQYSDKGRKEANQDFHGAYVPREPQLGSKGIAIALADGISSSEVSDVAAQYSVTGFLEDYFCTSDAWSVKKSAEHVLTATNSWLHSQTHQSQHRYDRERGYVCTFSGMVIKSTTAHLFHVGDARIYRLNGASLEQSLDGYRPEGILELEHDQSVAKGSLADHELRVPRCRRYGDRNPQILVGGTPLSPTGSRLLSLAVP